MGGPGPDHEKLRVEVKRTITPQETVTSDKKWTLRDVHGHLAGPLRVNILDSSAGDGTCQTVKFDFLPAGDDVC